MDDCELRALRFSPYNDVGSGSAPVISNNFEKNAYLLRVLAYNTRGNFASRLRIRSRKLTYVIRVIPRCKLENNSPPRHLKTSITLASRFAKRC